VRQQQEAAEHDAWFRRQVQIGLDAANAGDLIPGDEVEAKFAAKRAETRRRLEASAK
jgi:predicted transcriptional regulator